MNGSQFGQYSHVDTENIFQSIQHVLEAKKNILTIRIKSCLSNACPVFGLICFASIVITIGIIIVCLTASKEKNEECQRVFTAPNRKSTSSDSHPQSAAVGDLNNDSQLDIVVANTGADNVGIFLGSGNGTFQQQLTYSTGSGSHPYYVVVGDFNNDTRLDIITANHGTNSIGILVANDKRIFSNVRPHSLGNSRPVSVAVGDLNNDTCLDLVVTNDGTNSISILLGNCDASFSYQIKYSTGYDSLPCSVVVADLNDDSYLDIVISNAGTNNIGVFLGYGNGTFSSQNIYSTGIGSLPSSVIVGDFNGDHRPDIVVSNHGNGTIGIFLGYSNGTFAAIKISSISNSFHPHSAVAGDFNQDNILDIAVANSIDNNIMLLCGSQNGVFTLCEIHSTGFGSTPVFVVVGHFDNNGQLDVASVDTGSNDITIFSRSIMKAFSNQTTYTTGILAYPVSTAVNDFNNDGLLDIVVTNHGSSNIGIFLGYGNGTFKTQTTFSIGDHAFPYGVVTSDFNNDTWLDIAVPSTGSDSICILFGYGNGTFHGKTTLSTGKDSSPLALTVGDLNNDHLIDIIVANADSDNVGIHLGYGNGSFATQIILSTGTSSSPQSVVVNDFNNDTLADIVVSNYGASNVGIFLGYGNGTFKMQNGFSTGLNSNPYSIISSDFNNDSRLDIAVADYATNNIGILIGYGNGSFDRIRTFSMGLGSHPTVLASGDFNNDKILDIAVANYGTNYVGMLFGHGDGTFGMLTIYSTGDGSRPTSVAVGNFNRDAWLDMVVTNFESSTIGVFLGLDLIVVTAQVSYSTGSSSHPYSVVTGDFNNDTLLDILVVNSAHDNVGIWLGNEDGTFADEIIYPAEIGSNPQYATVGNFNNDHHLDILIINTRNDSITVAFGYGNGSFTPPQMYSTEDGSRPCFAVAGDLNNDNRVDITVLNKLTSTINVFLSFDYVTFETQSISSTGSSSLPRSIILGDFNNDTVLDIAVANSNDNNVGILLGYGNGSFAVQKTLATGNHSFPYSVATGDFNNDHALDIVVTNCDSDNIGIFLGYGNGTFASQTTISTGTDSQPRWVVVGDFNNDSRFDMAVALSNANGIRVLLGDGNGDFPTSRTYATGSNSMPFFITVSDFNGDSLLDLAVANYGTDNIGIFLGYGNGTFAGQMIFSTEDGSYPRSIATADFNNDSFVDIVVPNRVDSNIAIFYGYGNGSFAFQTVYSTGNDSIPLMLTVGDLNNDNIVDIAVANYGANNVGIFYGYGDGSFTDQMVIHTGDNSQPNALAIGDFNKDHQLDIAVANFQEGTVMILFRDGTQPFLGMMTYSTGTNARPSSMALADLNNDYYLDIIVANYGNDNLAILLGYGNGTFRELMIYATGTGSQPYSVSVGDFNNDSLIDIVVANAGNNNIGILLGYGNGMFSTAILHSTGHSSIPRSLAVADFNNDHCLDITVANSGSIDVLVLYGDCYGNVSLSKSYLMGYGSQPYSVTIGDFNKDNWTDIAVANYGTNDVNILLQTCTHS